MEQEIYRSKGVRLLPYTVNPDRSGITSGGGAIQLQEYKNDSMEQERNNLK